MGHGGGAGSIDDAQARRVYLSPLMCLCVVTYLFTQHSSGWRARGFFFLPRPFFFSCNVFFRWIRNLVDGVIDDRLSGNQQPARGTAVFSGWIMRGELFQRTPGLLGRVGGCGGKHGRRHQDGRDLDG